MTAPAPVAPRRTIPFDYAFRFGLTGEPGRVHNYTVRVSIESSFVAVSIGYGVVPRRDPLRFGPSKAEDFGAPAGQPFVLARAIGKPAVTLSDLRMNWVSNSLRRTIREESVATQSTGERNPERQRAADIIELLTRGVRINRELVRSFAALGDTAPIPLDQLAVLFEEIPPDSAHVSFLYQLFDEGTGRSFQSDPILSTAGLGIEDGDRPFRTFAVPISFDPLATIRMEVIERSDVPCELHVSLHGYRVLGGRGSPTDSRRQR